MSTRWQVSLILTLMVIFSGCTQHSIQKPDHVAKTQIAGKETLTKSKNPEVKNTIDPNCSNHIKIMTHASQYIANEFDKGYFLQKDIVGAKAQLFLIESNSPTVFVKNINEAKASYDFHYKLAEKYNCDLQNFKISPLERIKNIIKTFEQNDDKNRENHKGEK